MESLTWALGNLTPNALLDIFVVAVLIFGASFLLRGTQSMTLLRGMVIVFVGMLVVSNLFNLLALRWLMQNLVLILGIALPVIFQPELRRAFERLGQAGSWWNRRAPETVRARVIDEVCKATEKLSERRHGALIVLQKHSSLEEYIRTGIALDSEVSAQLLLTIFWPKTELHDGAGIIDPDGRLAAGACVLPLTASRNLPDPKLGTRHRAAIGISEVSDAVCVVVSEETGRISISNGGRLIAKLDLHRLRMILNALYGEEPPSLQRPLGQWRVQAQRWLSNLRARRQQS